jgi:hypothetical protein
MVGQELTVERPKLSEREVQRETRQLIEDAVKQEDAAQKQDAGAKPTSAQPGHEGHDHP